MNLLGHYDVNKLPLSLVAQLASVMKESFNRNLEQVLGIDYECWRILSLLAEESASAKSMRERLQLTRTQLSNSINTISDKGWVVNTTSTRQPVYELAATGRDALVEISKFARTWERRCYQNIDANEIHGFHSIINTLRLDVADIDLNREVLEEAS